MASATPPPDLQGEVHPQELDSCDDCGVQFLPDKSDAFDHREGLLCRDCKEAYDYSDDGVATQEEPLTQQIPVEPDDVPKEEEEEDGLAPQLAEVQTARSSEPEEAVDPAHEHQVGQVLNFLSRSNPVRFFYGILHGSGYPVMYDFIPQYKNSFETALKENCVNPELVSSAVRYINGSIRPEIRDRMKRPQVMGAAIVQLLAWNWINAIHHRSQTER